jgi:hypothetical protein
VSLDGRILDGDLPHRATRLVHEWASLHTEELTGCWDRVMHHQPPGTIDPLP